MSATLSPNEFESKFGKLVSKSCIAANRRQWELEQAAAKDVVKCPENRCELPRPKPERSPVDEPHRALPPPPRNSQRFSVRIISFRAILCDPDNLVGKAFVDCLRYSGLLPDDSSAIMDYSISQQKCSKKEERTEIVLEMIP